jgi:putative spermidine/putrescine transport system permease protein
MSRRLPRTALWALTVLVVLFLVAPIFVIVPLSLSTSAFLQFPPPGFSLHWYSELLADPLWLDALMLSVRVGVGAMVIAAIAGTAGAYALVRGGTPPRLRVAVEALFVLPLAVPTIVYAVGAYLVATQLGLIGSAWMLTLVYAVLGLPFVLLNVTAALRTTDRRLELVAQTMGASPWTAFRKVTLPLIAPAIAAGAFLTLMLTFDEAVVGLFLTDETAPTFPVKLYGSILYELNPLVPVASTLLVGGTVVVGGALLALRAATTRHWRGRVGGEGLEGQA